MPTLKHLRDELSELANPEIASHSQRFFKTGKGEYGEGDIFLGIRVPIIREVAKKYKLLPLEDCIDLLMSEIHEERLLAVILLVNQYKKAPPSQKQAIFDLYLKHRAYVNNWDIVDSSAHFIVGAHLEHQEKDLLVALAQSESLWDRRIAMISTYHYIKKGNFETALHIATLLVHDSEDLIQKAVGWMLREIGKKDQALEEEFLLVHYKTMPRTMLRYAIEKFEPEKRKAYLAGAL